MIVIELKKGTILLGKYCLLEELGCGSGGKVFLAVDVRLQKKWAVKIFAEDVSGEDEIRMLKELDHPMIPRIVDCMDNPCGIVMDYLDGVDLAALAKAGRVFSETEILGFGLALCDVLIYLHKRNPPVIYGDLKPHNLILTVEGKLKLIDFGCAFQAAGEKDGRKGGTRGYAAPEKYRGEESIRSDLYGLGVTLEAAGGKRLSKKLRRILKKCRRQNPARRYKDAEQVKGKLLACQRAWKNRKNNPGRLAWALAVLGGLLALNGLIAAGRETAYLEDIKEGRFYEAAVLFPQREEAYQYLLEEGIRRGETKKAVRQIEGLMALYPSQTENHHALCIQIGRLYLQGNPLEEDFLPDYEQAKKWYDTVSEQMYPQVKQEKELLEILSGCTGGAEWERAARSLKELSQSLEKKQEESAEERLREILSGVWLSNRYYLEKAGEKPLDWSIRLAEKAFALAEDCEPPGSIRLLNLRLLLAQACYLKGMREMDENALRTCLKLYEDAKADGLTLQQERKLLQKSAYIQEKLGAYDQAADCYEELLEKNPKDVDAFCQYALMELLETRNFDKAKQIYEQAGRLPGAKENRNYHILKERMEG